MPTIATLSRSVFHPARGAPSENLVGLVLEHARITPHHAAFIDGDRRPVMTYGELASRVFDYVAGIRGVGISANARILLLLRPDADVYALALAVLASGRSLVLVDGRRGARARLSALDDAHADVVVAPSALLMWWPLIPALRRARRFNSTAALLHARRRRVRVVGERLPRVTSVSVDTPAITSFSSGNSGRAKAVVRSHGVLLAQHRALGRALPLDERDVNLPGFPMAAIHNLCSGATTVLPDADLRAMAASCVPRLLRVMQRSGVTSLSGAPSFLARLSAAMIERGAPNTTVRRVVVGGGPVGRALCVDLHRVFPNADVQLVYGATEAEPIATVSAAELLAAEGDGFLVGLPVAYTRIQLASADGQAGLVGEVTVRGAQVAAGAWHRTGDIGRMDADGRLWLLGRVGAEVVHDGRVLHPYVAESIALTVRGVRAAALVARAGSPNGELHVELSSAATARTMDDVRLALARRGLATVSVRRRHAIPMDARHASKVSRAELLRIIAREDR